MKAPLAASPSRHDDPRRRLAALDRLRTTALYENLGSGLLEAIDAAIEDDRWLYAIQLGMEESPQAYVQRQQAARRLSQSLTSLHAILALNTRDFGDDHPRGEAARALSEELFPQGLRGAASLPGALLYATTGVLIDRSRRAPGDPLRELGLAPQIELLEQHHAALGAALAQHDDQAELERLNAQGQRALREIRQRCLDAYPGPDPESRAIRRAIEETLARQETRDPQRPDF